MAERSSCGSRTILVFRYPLGLALLVVSVVAGVVLLLSSKAGNDAVTIWDLALGVVIISSLGSVFLLAFKSMADTDSDKLSFLLGLPLTAKDGFLFSLLSSRNDSQQNAQAETFDYRQPWIDHVRGSLSAVIFVPALISGMVYCAINIVPFESDAGFFEYAFSAFIVVIGLVSWIFWLRCLHENYRSHRDFTFSVTSDSIVCECPSPLLGDSFQLSFQDIKAIDIESNYNGTHRCFVVDRSGTEYDLSYAYRNPVDRILNAIEKLSPTTPIFEFGVPRYPYGTRME